jgi:nitroimidazol reductase NimA-like FMN-containing flavoprotein (pyridoxamine 5'-phosphate oxidase superfamily)
MFKNLEDKEIEFVLKNNYIAYLGYIYLDRPYVVPITYFFDKEINAIICYSGDGHKMSSMKKNNAVSLQIAVIESVTNWESVLVHGAFEQLSGIDAKVYLHEYASGVKNVILEKDHKKVNFISEFCAKIYNDIVPTVFIIKIEQITGKKRKL